MRIVIEPDAEHVARRAADRVAVLLRRPRGGVLGLPAGETPRALYRELVRRHRQEGLSFAKVRTFNLDEFVDLPAGDPRSFAAAMRRDLFDHVDLDPEHTHLPDGCAEDLAAECERYEARIRAAGGIDLQVLGIGRSGHIAFNEPGSSLASRTRVKTLVAATRRDAASAFDGEHAVPALALTMGVGTILGARSCLVLACGAEKAEPVRRMVEGPVTAQVPASALQLHPEVSVMLDEDAAAALERREEYREAETAQRALEAWGRLPRPV